MIDIRCCDAWRSLHHETPDDLAECFNDETFCGWVHSHAWACCQAGTPLRQHVSQVREAMVTCGRIACDIESIVTSSIRRAARD